MSFRLIAITIALLAGSVAAEERYLLPVFVDVPGAHGSMFRSDLTLFNAGSTAAVRGFGPECTTACVLPPRLIGFTADAGETYKEFQKVGGPGLVIKTSGDVRMNLRVRDTSREQLSAGTEIPVIRESEMIDGPVYLLGVRPEVSIFRNRLRVYSFAPGRVRVVFVREADSVTLDQVTLDLTSRDVAADVAEFYPAFAETADFPVTGSSIRVHVEPLVGLDGLWAFITTTNNETQEITVITPQP